MGHRIGLLFEFFYHTVCTEVSRLVEGAGLASFVLNPLHHPTCKSVSLQHIDWSS